MSRRHLALLLFAAALWAPLRSEAQCTCEEDALSSLYADLIFVGKVRKIELQQDYKVAKISLDIERLDEGSYQGKAIQLFTAASEADCGVAFKEGERYVVFADHDWSGAYWGGAGTWYVHYCSYTMSTAEWEAFWRF